MNLTESLLRTFPLKFGKDIFQVEKYSTLEIKYETTIHSTIEIDDIKAIIDHIHPNDFWNINIAIENHDPISLGKNTEKIAAFVLELNQAKRTIEEERVNINILITKNYNGHINIYDFGLFDKFVNDLGPVSFLKVINKDLKDNGGLCFYVYDDSFEEFNTLFLKFSKAPPKDDNVSFCETHKIRENCHFGNQDEYPYSPIYFNLIQRPEAKNNTIITLDSLCFLFSIICIFDITTINDSELYYKLNGYKTFEGKLTYDELPLDSLGTYVKIFEWIYSESSNVSDKIGLVRNILSIYLKTNSLDIPEGVFYSVKSGFKTYLQENLNRYIEVRNKIGEQLQTLTHRANLVIDEYLNKYQKNIISFITFFVSVLLIQVLNNKQFSEVFTKDATIIAFSILAVSTVFMIISLLHLNNEKQRLIKKYDNLKKRFRDLLIKEDIQKILRNDEEFNDDIQYLITHRKLYTIMWILTIIFFFIAVVSLSTYLNWKTISDFIFKYNTQ